MVTSGARQTPPGARPNRGALEGGPPELPGRSLDPVGNDRDQRNDRAADGQAQRLVPTTVGRQNPAYRPALLFIPSFICKDAGRHGGLQGRYNGLPLQPTPTIPARRERVSSSPLLRG